MFKRFKKTTPEVILAQDDEIRLAEQAVQSLMDDVMAAEVKLNRSKAEAARCMADPGAVLPQELQAALLTERAAMAAHATAVEAHRIAHNNLEERKAMLHQEQVQADQAEKFAAYTEALSAYTGQCEALIPASMQLRLLAREAGVFVPRWEPADLLLDTDSEVFIMGQPVKIWTHG